MSNFSNNLVALRKSKGLTQQQASKAVGTDYELYQKYEFDMQEPDLEFINKVADFYEVDPVDLKSESFASKINKNEQSPKKENISADLRKVLDTESDNVSSKSRAGASALAFFLGAFGAHNFYLEKKSTAIFQLILTLTVIGSIASSIWAFIDFIMILCGSAKDGDGRDVKQW